MSHPIIKKPAIAVVAMSGVFSRAIGREQFWLNMIEKVDGAVEIPEERRHASWGWVYNNAPSPDKAYGKRACVVRQFDFDPQGYELSADFLSGLDLLHQWVLFAGREALAQTGSDSIDPKRAGVILAAIALPTALSSIHARRVLGPEIQRGLLSGSTLYENLEKPAAVCARVVSSPAALLSQALGLKAGSYTLDAACASSLYAVKLACDKLQAYEADLMLAGGVSGADTLYTQIGFSQLRALSKSGRCAPFDHRADGLVVGEGAGILVLKRLDDALAHGDTVYGVIRGIGLSNDMRGNLLAPESAGQLRAMKAAYEASGWSPSDVDYIECHGAGTPVGDATELSSLRTLWQDEAWEPGQCALGAVKSFVGHLLTGAGAAGMIRTLLALHHHVLPPTLNFERPSDDSPLIDSPFRVPVSAEAWPRRDSQTPRRAAVSAFGFGGINAHVLIESYEPELDPLPTPKRHRIDVGGTSTSAIAIVGLETCLGSLSDLQAFEQAVFNGTCALVPAPAHRWKSPVSLDSFLGGRPSIGGFISEVPVAMGEFQIQPNEIPDILPQQLLMLKTAAGAMLDAGLPLREMRTRMGTVIGISYDYEANNFHLRWSLPHMVKQWLDGEKKVIDAGRLDQWLSEAREGCGPPLTATRTLGALGGIVASRIAREFRFGGPSFVVSAEEASGFRALEIGVNLLQSGDTDAMLVGAVDLHCDERNLTTLHPRLPISRANRISPFDRQSDGTLPGEGAVALVLKRLEDAQADKNRIYAVIKGIGSAGGGDMAPAKPSVATYTASLQMALDQARIEPGRITLLESHASGIQDQDDVEAQALHSAFTNYEASADKKIAVGTSKPLIGHCGAVSGLASLAKAVVSMHHRMIAPAVNFKAPRQPDWRQGPFYFPHKAAFWPRNRTDGPRYACVAAMTHDGNCMHVVLEESPDHLRSTATAKNMHHQGPMGPLPHGLFRVRGNSDSDVLQQLDALSQLSRGGSSLEALACEWFGRSRPSSGPHSAGLAIVADSPDSLRAHIGDARQAVQAQVPRRLSRQGGVAYLALPEDARGNVAFVFPGSGNHYVGLGRSLSTRWPGILRRMEADTEHLFDQMLPQVYDPRRSDWSSGWQADAYRELIQDPLHTIFGQVVFGGQMAHLLKSFGIAPDAVIGYSLGESAGLLATGAWPDRGRMLSRLKASELFKNQLTGDCLSVRKAWQLPDAQEVLWQVAAINRPAQTIDEVIADLPYVRRLIINTPDECVIGGLKNQVDQAIERLKCDAVVLDGVVTVHCDAAEPVAEAYKDLHRFDTTPIDGMTYYSCAQGKSYPLTSEAAADSILQQALHGFDFPATIEQAYADGIRLFLEVGPHASCTRMIDRILEGRPHLAVAANNRSEDECFSLLKCLATLAAAGLPMDLSPLYGYAEKQPATTVKDPSAIIRVPVGGRPFAIPDLPVQSFTPPPEPVSAATVTPKPPPVESADGDIDLYNIIQAFDENVALTSRAHDQFLALSEELRTRLGQALDLQHQLLNTLSRRQLADAGLKSPAADMPGLKAAGEPSDRPAPQQTPPITVAFTREQCMEYAVGSVGKVLGPAFDIIDTYPVRVRLPDEPLMLVDRIISVKGEPCSMGAGNVVTEHDVFPGAWYLDGGVTPVCITVEAGQADLFLSGYLGIDHQVKGKRTYRLLDARIVFHRGLPRPGETIRYDIHIDKFVNQDETYLFFFRYEGFIGDQHLMTMTDGCAGFFTEAEVRQSGGIILTEDDRRMNIDIQGAPYRPLVPLDDASYDDDQLEALRHGDAGACFGDAFRGIRLPAPLQLPTGRMRLTHRITTLEPQGGRFGKGYIKAEADIHPDDWFLTCHFVDDMVMPGTLMYDCCSQTLRVLLLRLGWITDKADVCYEPVLGVQCRLKCRGPVTPKTQKVHYAVEIKEIGYRPEPYVVADAHMDADGQYIVFFKNMSMQITGLTQAEIETFWQQRNSSGQGPASNRTEHRTGTTPEPLFLHDHILEFAVGSPSKAFGEPYRPFDRERKIARLPGPPYCFIHRIQSADAEPWVLEPTGWITAQYDMPADAWYFAADRSGCMPFAVLLEIALQPCGWLAAYLGSALKNDIDLKFRNLGGQALIHANLFPKDQTLTMRARLTKVSEAAAMIIEHFDFQVFSGDTTVYDGTTYFGFFTAQALTQQKGLQEKIFIPGQQDLISPESPDLPEEPPITPEDVVAGRIFTPAGLAMPAKALCMIDTIEAYAPEGGPHGLGFVRGVKIVDPEEWFFKAHFYQDPVCPGSLGIESFLQLIKYAAIMRWPELINTHQFQALAENEHQWSYRGQVIPTNRKVVVDAVITHVADGPSYTIKADGWLHVDGLSIYQMKDFGLRLVPGN